MAGRPDGRASGGGQDRLAIIRGSLASMVSRLLPEADIGVTDNLFDLGADSVLLARLIGQIKDRFDADLDFVAVYDDPTIAEIARQIGVAPADDGRGERHGHAADGHAADDHIERVVPTTLGQSWLLAREKGPNPPQREPMIVGLALDRPLEHGLLRSALDAVVRRHSALRMHFPDDDVDTARCRALPDGHWPLRSVELPDRAAAAARADVVDRSLRDLGLAFDHAAYPLVRATVLTEPDGRQLLGMALDHTVFDAMSAPVLVADLAAMTVHFAEGGGHPAVEREVSRFDRFGATQRHWLASESGKASVAAWRAQWERVGPFPPVDLPRRADGDDVGAAGGVWRRDLSTRLGARLRRRASVTRSTVFMLVAAAVLVAAREQGHTDVPGLVFPSSGRLWPGTQDAIGCFANRVTLSVDLSRASSLDASLEAVRAGVLNALRHQLVPFTFLQYTFAPETHGRWPDVPYLFLNVLQETVPPRLGGIDSEFVDLAVPAARAVYPSISIEYELTRTHADRLTCHYPSARYTGATIDAFASRIAELLDRL